MYEFSDYFQKELRDQPYRAPGEELEDYLRLLDMILESYLEFRGLGTQKKLFSRGLVITETEMGAYFEMPPYYRERDICDPLMAEAAEEAFGYVAGRTEKTEEAGAGDLLRIAPLKKRFELDRTELFAVLLALSAGIDRRYERIFGFLQDDITKGTPTLGLLFSLVCRITKREGAEQAEPRPLDEKMYRYFLVPGEDTEALNTPLVLNPSMRRMLLGLPDRDGGEEGAFHVFREEEGIPLFFEESARELSRVLGGGRYACCYLESSDADTVQHVAYRAAAEQETELLLLDLKAHMDLSRARQQEALSALFLKLKLSGGIVLARFPEIDGENGAASEKDRSLVSKYWKLLERISAEAKPSVVLLYGEAREPGVLAVRAVPALRIPAPSVSLRMEIWNHFLTRREEVRIAENVVIPDLSDCYEISYGTIRHAAIQAIAEAELKEEPVVERADILEALRQLNQVSFSGLATYVKPVYTWEDITMADSQREVLKAACDRYRLRNRVGEAWGLKKRNAYGNGVSLLLYGPPGTGKTMAAQVVGNELGVPLYRVDISRIFSKYIGETEKNLSMIFDAASKADVILFFDEADALFAKRTEVSSSNDKYSNSETAFLLQKIEEYDGMSILATNHYNNFDSAFVRRITYAVHLDNPDEEARYLLWSTILPKEAELEENIDFRFFAKQFELSGSNIKSILYAVAYMAGAEGTVIGTEHIVRALQYEYKKLGRLVERSAFGPYAFYLNA